MASANVPTMSLPQAPSLRAKQRTSAEVIVVGGGLSGLQAAYEVQKAGLTCLVLDEGRTLGASWTNRDAYDLGVDEALHHRVMGLLGELGVASEFLEKRDAYSSCLTGDLTSLDTNDRHSFTRVRNNLETLSRKVNINKPSEMLPQFGSMTVKELARSHGANPAVLEMADSWTRALLGTSADEVAALTFLLHCKTHGGFRQALETRRKWRLRDGLHHAIAEKLHPGSVLDSQQVEQIDQTAGSKVVLTTTDGQIFQCTRVILALPLSRYSELVFTPEVSDNKKWLWKSSSPEKAEIVPIPAARLKDLEQDQWRPEGHVHIAGSETSYTWRGHVEGAIAAGSRVVAEVLEQSSPYSGLLTARL